MCFWESLTVLNTIEPLSFVPGRGPSHRLPAGCFARCLYSLFAVEPLCQSGDNRPIDFLRYVGRLGWHGSGQASTPRYRPCLLLVILAMLLDVPPSGRPPGSLHPYDVSSSYDLRLLSSSANDGVVSANTALCFRLACLLSAMCSESFSFRSC